MLTLPRNVTRARFTSSISRSYASYSNEGHSRPSTPNCLSLLSSPTRQRERRDHNSVPHIVQITPQISRFPPYKKSTRLVGQLTHLPGRSRKQEEGRFCNYAEMVQRVTRPQTCQVTPQRVHSTVSLRKPTRVPGVYPDLTTPPVPGHLLFRIKASSTQTHPNFSTHFIQLLSRSRETNIRITWSSVKVVLFELFKFEKLCSGISLWYVCE